VDLFELIGWLWTNGLVIPMTNFLVLVARLSLGSFGVAIILFTLFVRAITWPLTRQQLHATKSMQVAQPRIQQIQKQYKDPRRRQEETMKVYRELGVNPLGCIFPMLIQFPIWIALYQAIRITLGTTPESLLDLSQQLYPWGFLRTAVPLEKHFLWLDLSRPDSTLIMAVLVGASAWVQQKMATPTSATMDPQQQSMNQTMLWMMPLMFAFFTLQFPSGLALYWVATNVISIGLQYVYMGRRTSLRQLLSVAPAPTPAVQQPSASSSLPEEEQDASEEAQEGTTAATRPRRRRRRGRRKR
jgi:YidC/Oxa1 family membrane protein insertase